MLLGIQIFTVRGESIYKEKNKYKLKDGKESDAVVLNLNWMDFPGSAVYKNPPASCRGHWFDPWSGKIPKAREQLSQWITITEPECSSS